MCIFRALKTIFEEEEEEEEEKDSQHLRLSLPVYSLMEDLFE